MVVEQLYTRSTDRPLALDLSKRHVDVRRIARAQTLFAALLRLGWQAEDLDQEVLMAVYARQAMKSRYDPARAGIGKYLHILTRGVLQNVFEKTLRNRGREPVGLSRDAALAAAEVLDMAEPAIPWLPDVDGVYELQPPYNAVRVVEVGRVWVHVALLEPPDKDPPPNRIKRKHWTGKLL